MSASRTSRAMRSSGRRSRAVPGEPDFRFAAENVYSILSRRQSRRGRAIGFRERLTRNRRAFGAQRGQRPRARKVDQSVLLGFGFGFGGRPQSLLGILPKLLGRGHRMLPALHWPSASDARRGLLAAVEGNLAPRLD